MTQYPHNKVIEIQVFKATGMYDEPSNCDKDQGTGE